MLSTVKQLRLSKPRISGTYVVCLDKVRLKTFTGLKMHHDECRLCNIKLGHANMCTIGKLAK